LTRASPSATVVVAAYNAASTIGDCLDSLAALRYPRELLEIIAVDNMSTDATRAEIHRRGGVVLVQEATRGAAAARNAGIRRARGAVVAFTDADCTVDPDWLSELVGPLADPQVGIVGGRNLARRGANPAERFGEIIHEHYAAIHVWRPPYVISMNWASRRSVLLEAGLFDERFLRGQDVDLSYRIGRAGYRLAYQPTAIVYHRNERTLLGLAREGWQHGFHSVELRRVHADYIAECLGDDREHVEYTAPPSPSRYPLAFETGKTLGRQAGRLRSSVTRARRQPRSRT
jgi:GT2 family glycosyltransferase